MHGKNYFPPPTFVVRNLFHQLKRSKNYILQYFSSIGFILKKFSVHFFCVFLCVIPRENLLLQIFRMINTTKEIVFFEIKNNEKIFSEKQSKKKKKKFKLTLLIECVQFTYLSLLLLNIINPFSPSLDKIKTKSLCCEIILLSSFFCGIFI